MSLQKEGNSIPIQKRNKRPDLDKRGMQRLLILTQRDF